MVEEAAKKQPVGNTSTDVEKTDGLGVELFLRKKHLHGRGEDVLEGDRRSGGLETPPRTWRRRIVFVGISPEAGNTSTDVEKTSRI